jgi:hypothetical protein
MNLHTDITRLWAFPASAAMTAILFCSQLVIAENYTAQADALLAARHATPVALSASGAARRPQI